MIPLATIWQSLENGLFYKVLDNSDGEVVATTRILKTPSAADSFSWLGTVPEFLHHFKPASQHIWQ